MSVRGPPPGGVKPPARPAGDDEDDLDLILTLTPTLILTLTSNVLFCPVLGVTSLVLRR